jgi:putative transposase
MTGIGEKSSIAMGQNVNKIIAKQLERLEKIKSIPTIKNHRKKKIERRINMKISNRIDDLHWKVINTLIGSYKAIYLGDMSAKGIVKKSNNVLSPIQKGACLRTRYYDFRKKLKYKCERHKITFKLINESYTSKMCSLCGAINENLNGSKIFDCAKCLTSMDRDINGARNIYNKSLI